MRMVHVMLWFDTEDYITPESDDALRELQAMLQSLGIRGIFKMVGEKARVLESRRRTDVLSAMAFHEVGYHTDYHSVHPTPSEYLEGYSFREGAYEFERCEASGLADVNRVFEMKSACYGQPGYSFAPQTYAALNHWGIRVYLDVHDAVTLDHRPFWYGGLLNFTDLTGVMRMELREGGLDQAKRQFDELYEQLSEQSGFISIYYHPCEFACTEFWDDANFGNGRNTPRSEWQPAKTREPKQMHHLLQQLREFLKYTLSRSDVQYITASEAYALESTSKAPLSDSQVVSLATQVGDELYFVEMDKHVLSASDIFKTLYQTVLGRAFPAGVVSVSPSDVLYGPERAFESDSVGEVSVAEVKQALATSTYPKVFEFYQLPDYFEVSGARVSAVDMTCTMAHIVANHLADDHLVRIVKGRLRSMQNVTDNALWGDKWVIFPRDLKVPNLIRIARQQTWTLKPARF